MNGGWAGDWNLSFFLVSGSSNPVLSRSWNFSVSLVFFLSFAKFAKFVSLAFHDCCSGAANWLSGGEKIVLYVVCFAYSLASLLLSLLLVVLLLVFSFVVLLNCVYLNP